MYHKINSVFDHRRLQQSRSPSPSSSSSSSSSSSTSSLFTTFAAIVTCLILFTIIIISTISIHQQKDFDFDFDYSKVTIKIETVIPHLHLEKESSISQELSNTIQFLESFEGKEVSKKFQNITSKFINDQCQNHDHDNINFMMTWFSPLESFGKRELLSIESIFKTHPKSCLIILSSTLDSSQGYKILKPFQDLGYKVIAITPDLPFLLKDTAGESWLEEIKNGKRDPGKISLAQNLSNLIRLVYLYKFGGVYIDTDMIILKSFKGLKNAIGAQTLDPITRNWTRLNNAVMIFDKNHEFLVKCIDEFSTNFDGNVWGYNGPYLVSRVAKDFEGRSDFSVMRPYGFYSVNWVEIEKLFRVPRSEEEMKRVEVKVKEMKRLSYGLHLWNKFSKKLEIEKGSVMDSLVSEYCVLCNQNNINNVSIS